jgi:NAD(P)-dependent dehydrogenase (short-subunit alcohol dehydrogenase family)
VTVEVSLEGKVALVTGVGPNIGSGIALALAKYGAKVACNDVDEAAIKACIARIERNGGEAMAAPGDVTDEASVQGYIGSVLDRWGRLDICVNNAALLGGRCGSPRWETSSTPSMPPARWLSAASRARSCASPRPTAGRGRRASARTRSTRAA